MRPTVRQFEGSGGYAAWAVTAPHAERLLWVEQAPSMHHWDCYCPGCVVACRARSSLALMQNAIFGKMGVFE